MVSARNIAGSPQRSLVTAAVCAAAFLGPLVLPAISVRGGDRIGPELAGAPRRRGLVVFVMDTSGSMRIRDAGSPLAPETRLEYATRELSGTLSGLGEHADLVFDVVACSTGVESLSASQGLDGPMSLDAGSERAVAEFLAERPIGGMTHLAAALKEAFDLCRRAPKSLQPGSILVFTDGIPTFGRSKSGPVSTEELLSWVRGSAPAGVKVSAYAISPTLEGTSFLQDLCAETRGILFTP